MKYNIVALPGDGIGPEITKQAIRVLSAAAEKCGFEVSVNYAYIGGAAIDAEGVPITEETIKCCKAADAVILGAVGGPKWDDTSAKIRPEQGLLKIRSELGLFANLRPSVVYPALRSASPLKDELLEKGLDVMIVRELTGGIYFGNRGRDTIDGINCAYDTERYSVDEISRIAHVAFALANKRERRLCSIDKANVLESSRLWRETVIEVSKEYPEVALTHMYVDNAAMQLVRDPSQFDTIVTSNMFGDILSDEASQITGSIGMLASASLGSGSLGLYEPAHGSAPDIAGLDIANPIATILSAAMMLRYSLNQPGAAALIEKAVGSVLDSGIRTADLGFSGRDFVGTSAMGQAVIDALMNNS